MPKQERYSTAASVSAAPAHAVAALNASCSPHSFGTAVGDAEVLLPQVNAATAATGLPCIREAYDGPPTETVCRMRGRACAGREDAAAAVKNGRREQQQQQQGQPSSSLEDPGKALETKGGWSQPQEQQQQVCTAHDQHWQPYAEDEDYVSECRRLRLLLHLQLEVHERQKEAEQKRQQQMQEQLHAAQQHLRETEKALLTAQQQQQEMQAQLDAAQGQMLLQTKAQQQLLLLDGGRCEDGSREVKRCMWKMEMQQMQHEAVLRKQQARLLEARGICRRWLAAHYPEEATAAVTPASQTRAAAAAAAGEAADPLGISSTAAAAGDAHIPAAIPAAEAAAGTTAGLSGVSARSLLSELLLPLLQEVVDFCSSSINGTSCNSASDDRAAPATAAVVIPADVPAQAACLLQQPASAAAVSPGPPQRAPLGLHARSRDDPAESAAAIAVAAAAAPAAAAAGSEGEGGLEGGLRGASRVGGSYIHQSQWGSRAAQCVVVPPLHGVGGTAQQEEEKQRQQQPQQGGELRSPRSQRRSEGQVSRRSRSRVGGSHYSSSRRSNNSTPGSYISSSDNSSAGSQMSSTRDARRASSAGGREECVRDNDGAERRLTMDSSRTQDSQSSLSQDTSSPSPRLPVRVSTWRGRPAFVPRLNLTGESDEEEEEEEGKAEQAAVAAALPQLPQPQQQQHQASLQQEQLLPQQGTPLWEQQQQQRQLTVLQEQQQQEAAEHKESGSSGDAVQEQGDTTREAQQQQQQRVEDAFTSGEERWFERMWQGRQQQPHAAAGQQRQKADAEQQRVAVVAVSQPQKIRVAQLKQQQQVVGQQQARSPEVVQEQGPHLQMKEERHREEQRGQAAEGRALNAGAPQEGDLQRGAAEQQFGGRGVAAAEEFPTFRREEIEAAEGGGSVCGRIEGDKQQQQPAQREQQEDAQHERAAPEKFTAAAAAERGAPSWSCFRESSAQACLRRSGASSTKGRVSVEQTHCVEEQEDIRHHLFLQLQQQEPDVGALEARQSGSQQQRTRLEQNEEEQQQQQQQNPQQQGSQYNRRRCNGQLQLGSPLEQQQHSWQGQHVSSWRSALEQQEEAKRDTVAQREEQPTASRSRARTEVALLARSRVEATWRLQQQLQQRQQPPVHLQPLQQPQLARPQPQRDACTDVPGEGRSICTICVQQRTASQLEGAGCSSCCCVERRTSSTRRRSCESDCSKSPPSSSCYYYRQMRGHSDQGRCYVCCDDGQRQSSRRARSGSNSETATPRGKSSVSGERLAAPCAAPQSMRATAGRRAATVAANGEADAAADAVRHTESVVLTGSVQQQQEQQREEEVGAGEGLLGAAACALIDMNRRCQAARDRRAWCWCRSSSRSSDSCSDEVLSATPPSHHACPNIGGENNRCDCNSSRRSRSSPLDRVDGRGRSRRCHRNRETRCSRCNSSMMHSCSGSSAESRCDCMRSDSEGGCRCCCYSVSSSKGSSSHMSRSFSGSKGSSSSGAHRFCERRNNSSYSWQVFRAEDRSAGAEAKRVEAVKQQQTVCPLNALVSEQSGDSSSSAGFAAEPSLLHQRVSSSRSRSPAVCSDRKKCLPLSDNDDDEDTLVYFDSPPPAGTFYTTLPDSSGGEVAAGWRVLGSPRAAAGSRGGSRRTFLQQDERSQREGKVGGGEREKKQMLQQVEEQGQQTAEEQQRRQEQQQHKDGPHRHEDSPKKKEEKEVTRSMGTSQREDVYQQPNNRKKKPQPNPDAQRIHGEQQQMQQHGGHAEREIRSVLGEAWSGLPGAPDTSEISNERSGEAVGGEAAGDEIREDRASIFASGATEEPKGKSSLAVFAVSGTEQLSAGGGGHQQQQEAVQQLLVKSGLDPELLLDKRGATCRSRTGGFRCCSKGAAVARKGSRWGKDTAFLGTGAAPVAGSEACSALSSSCNEYIVSGSCALQGGCAASGKPAEAEAVAAAAAVRSSSLPISRLPTTASTEEGFLANRSSTAGLKESLPREISVPLQAPAGDEYPPLQQQQQQRQEEQQQVQQRGQLHQQQQRQQEAVCTVGILEEPFCSFLSMHSATSSVLGCSLHQQQQQRLSEEPAVSQRVHALLARGKEATSAGEPGGVGDVCCPTSKERERFESGETTAATDETAVPPEQASELLDGLGCAAAHAPTKGGSRPDADRGFRSPTQRRGMWGAATTEAATAVAAAEAENQEREHRLLPSPAAFDAASAGGGAANDDAEAPKRTCGLLKRSAAPAQQEECVLRAACFDSTASLVNDSEVEGRVKLLSAPENRLRCAASSFAADAAAAGGVSSCLPEKQRVSSEKRRDSTATAGGVRSSSLLWMAGDREAPDTSRVYNFGKKFPRKRQTLHRCSRAEASSPLGECRDMLQLQGQQTLMQYMQQQQQLLREQRPAEGAAGEHERQWRCPRMQQQQQRKNDGDRRCLRVAETAAQQGSPTEGKISSVHAYSRESYAEKEKQLFFSAGLSMVSSSGFSPAAAPRAAARQQHHGGDGGAVVDHSSVDEEQNCLRCCTGFCCREEFIGISDFEDRRRGRPAKKRSNGAAGGPAAPPAEGAAATDSHPAQQHCFHPSWHCLLESQQGSLVPARTTAAAEQNALSSGRAVHGSSCYTPDVSLPQHRPQEAKFLQVIGAATRASSVHCRSLPSLPRTSRSLPPCRRRSGASFPVSAHAQKAGASSAKIDLETARCWRAKGVPLDSSTASMHCVSDAHCRHPCTADYCCWRRCLCTACAAGTAASAQLAMQPPMITECSSDVKHCD